MFGSKNVYSLARLYASKEKPSSYLLYKYGAGFSKFLQKIPALCELGYLTDLIRLQQQIRLSYHARLRPIYLEKPSQAPRYSYFNCMLSV